MACACKINQDIERIHRYYSKNGKTAGTNKPQMSINKKDAAVTIFIYLLLLPFIPLIFIGLIFYAIFSKGKKISMGKFLGFIHKTRNGKKQQII